MQSPNLSDGNKREDISVAREIPGSPKQLLDLDRRKRETEQIRKSQKERGETLLRRDKRRFKSSVQAKGNVMEKQIMQDKNIKSESKKNGSKKSERSRKKLPQKKKKKMDNGKMTRKSKRKTVNNKNRKFLSKCSPTTKCSNAGGFCKRTNYCLLKVGPNANSICKGLCTCCKETSSEFSFQHFGL